MFRTLHRWIGIVAALILTIIALSGAALAVFPAMDSLQAVQPDANLSVADLVARVEIQHPYVEQIKRAPSGKITVYWFNNGEPGAAIIDPTTGADIGSADPNAVERWLTNLHRALFLDDGGRIIVALGALIMLGLSVTGIQLVARRMGGWRAWLSPARGPMAGRLHVQIARITVVGLLFSSITALWMAATTFDLTPQAQTKPDFPTEVSGKTGFAPSDMALLETILASDLRSLTFPYDGDATDVYTVETANGSGYLDQGTGEVLAWQNPTLMTKITETIYMLHTGQGAAIIGLLLGLCALGVPVLAISGTLVWLRSRKGTSPIKGTVTASKAQAILLVASEGGSTWGFAGTLGTGLIKAGKSVHIAPLNTYDPTKYASAEQIVILAATYGDGDAPAHAQGFLAQLNKLGAPTAPLSVLGFGDSSFPAFCSYAQTIETTAQGLGGATNLPMDRIDRQSPQQFARWGRNLGQVMGVTLDLNHVPNQPKSHPLTLISRRDYGYETQSPIAILRFALPKRSLWSRLTGGGFGSFAAGDLLAVQPVGSHLARLYSLASGSRDGFVEIAVRKHTGGLCSGQLMALQVGDMIQAYLRPNPAFHAPKDAAPLILIGAGTGVGPLAGIIRANTSKRPMHLWFGIRHKDSDFLYGDDLMDWSAEGRLSTLRLACSRMAAGIYVQDALRKDAEHLRDLLQSGARIMVCGGRDMAHGVRGALTDILHKTDLSFDQLRAKGRYVEDVY